MRIAILAHVRHPIAPPFAGGMESHCWHLAAGLRDRGHDVTLFASGDSDPRFPIDPVIPIYYEHSFPGAEHRGFQPLVAHLDHGYAAACDRIAAGSFDVLHNHSLHRFPLAAERLAAIPTVTALHVPPYDALRWFVHASAITCHRITATSAHHLAAWWPDGAPDVASVLHNGIDPAAWPFVAEGGDRAIWCGRIAQDKGPHLAIQAVRLAGVPLTLFGPIEDQTYWDTEVAPLLTGDIGYGGHVDAEALAVEMGRSSLLVFTPGWDEPFGLVAVEAMACGLPVAAFDRGAAREIIGPAGRFAPAGDVPALGRAIIEARAMPRAPQRAHVEAAFTQDRWLDRCEALYRDVIAARVAS